MFISRKRIAAALILALVTISALTYYWFFSPGSIKPDILPVEDHVKCDLLIKNGTVVDGSGAKPFRADIAVRDVGVRIGSFSAEAGRVIDAEGKVVAWFYQPPFSY